VHDDDDAQDPLNEDDANDLKIIIKLKLDLLEYLN
jgi:hypothetical protein